MAELTREKFEKKIKKYLEQQNKKNDYAFDTSVILQNLMDSYDGGISFSENWEIADEYIKSVIPQYGNGNAEALRMGHQQEKEREQYEQQQQAEQQQALEQVKNNLNPDLEKYFFVPRQLIKALRAGDFNGLIFFGNAGLGKTFCVETEVPKNELLKVDTHITSLELVNLAYDNGNGCRDKIIFFDDVANILENPLNIGILKAMLWSVSGKRTITYKSTQNRINLPPSIEFFGKVIIATNKENIDNPHLLAVLSRCLQFKFNFDKATMMKMLTEYAKTLETKLSHDEKISVVTDFLWRRKSAILNLNFRLVKHLVLLREYCKVNNIEWQQFLTSQLEIKPEVKELYNLLATTDDKTACQEWQEITGQSRRQFYHIKKKFWCKDEITFALTETEQQQASAPIMAI